MMEALLTDAMFAVPESKPGAVVRLDKEDVDNGTGAKVIVNDKEDAEMLAAEVR